MPLRECISIFLSLHKYPASMCFRVQWGSYVDNVRGKWHLHVYAHWYLRLRFWVCPLSTKCLRVVYFLWKWMAFKVYPSASMRMSICFAEGHLLQCLNYLFFFLKVLDMTLRVAPRFFLCRLSSQKIWVNLNEGLKMYLMKSKIRSIFLRNSLVLIKFSITFIDHTRQWLAISQ